MRNVLLLTAEYPNPDSNYDTPVIHYFTKEWCKMGYNVKVIHYRSIFPIFYYWLASLINKQVKKHVKTDFVPTKRRTKDLHYIKDSVLVYNFPIFKFIPHGKYQNTIINKQIDKILKLNDADSFIPDIIIGHFYNPQIEIVSKLKHYYQNARTCIVLHESPEIIKKTYPKQYQSLFNNIDIWGFRFKSLKDKFEMIFGYNYKTFICHSGVPEKYIYSTNTNKSFENKVKKFCYAGMLIPLKRVSDIINALYKSFPLKDFELNIIGEGMERERLGKLTQTLGIQSNVIFLGQMQRDEVQKIMNDADCYIMVSESEAFGLVYLEAMGKGCITIGTKGQGIDGVIQHGINGFLCGAKNSDELSEIINQINKLPSHELIKISQNAVETAQEMTDTKAAKKYINTIIEF